MSSRLQELTNAVRLLACFFFMLCAAGLVRADEYDELRSKWVTHLTGGSVNTADADIAAQLGFLTSNAQLHWDGMRKEPGRTTLWDDTAFTTSSSHISYAYQHLRAMALAFSTAGSPLQGNAALGGDKRVSFLLDAAASTGSTGWLQYASRNAGANKPVLLIVTP